ncbi:MAG TPA: hypothetical protein VH253_10535 [Phycisphaerae bacterium]|nr:hypothetical protein [Phycisphaerae bacterium]
MSQPPLLLPSSPQPAPPRHVTVVAVRWENLFEFIHLFRGFRLAINPAKIFLALMAILLLYGAGRLFDAVWGPQVYVGEIERYQTQKPEAFARARDDQLRQRTENLRSALSLESMNDTSLGQEQMARVNDDPRAMYRLLKESYERRFHDEVNAAHRDRLTHEVPDGAGLPPGTPTPAELEQQERAAAAGRLYSSITNARAMAGRGIFDAFLAYELRQFDLLIDNTLSFVRVSPVRQDTLTTDGGLNANSGDAAAVSGSLFTTSGDRLWRSDTVAGCLANMTITAPSWLFTATAPMQYRPANADTWSGWTKMIAYRAMYLLSLVTLAVFALVVVAFTGAVIARLSALELAGIERAPLAEVFRFAGGRLWTFIKTPIAPFLILLAIGILMAVAALLGAIPFVGPVILGAIFILFLAVGFVLMLLLLGILGGFNLLYPTLAVEGADAFDAMSRAFAYVYDRPWRLLFYTTVSLIYGVVTLLFVSFALYLLLILTHTFAGWGMSLLGYHYGAYSGVAKLDTLWPAPAFMHLISPINWWAMSWPEYLGALFLHFWLFLLISCCGAYVISYYFSSHTIMYLLLRRSVDAQPITEVYLDEPAATNPGAAIAAAPAADAPAAPPAPGAA